MSNPPPPILVYRRKATPAAPHSELDRPPYESQSVFQPVEPRAFGPRRSTRLLRVAQFRVTRSLHLLSLRPLQSPVQSLFPSRRAGVRIRLYHPHHWFYRSIFFEMVLGGFPVRGSGQASSFVTSSFCRTPDGRVHTFLAAVWGLSIDSLLIQST